METRWISKPVHNTDKFEKSGLSKELLNILINREIDTKEKIERFIIPKVEDIISPFKYSDVSKAIEKIIEVGEKGRKIYIYGDYDVDGITSTSLCYLALSELGYNVHYYIPLRDEGYGLNCEALSEIKKEGGELVITVDCGISSLNEIKHSNTLGLDVIITDHHDINNELPNAYAIINPKREDNEYSFKYLAGVGTAFILVLGLFEKLKRKEEAYKYLDIVAIGTIADIVPLREENRIFTKIGLEMLKTTKHPGLKILLQQIFENYSEKTFNTYDVGFIIAPIFNAAGRLEDAKMGVRLFISDSKTEAKEISKKLISQNIERKEVQGDILEKVEGMIDKNNYQDDNVIVVSGEGFHHGVIGIVASKIVDKYYKPTIIIEEKDGIGKASCRSIEGYSIIEGLNSMKELFIKYGGHPGAAGFSIAINKIDEFRKRINEHAKRNITSEEYKKPIKIDKELSFNKLTYNFNEELGKAEPFGYGNPTPLFQVKNITLNRVRLIGKDKSHIMFDAISQDGIALKNCVWFGKAHKFEELVESNGVDIVFKLKVDTYMDRFNVKMFVEDIRKSNEIPNKLKEMIDLYDSSFPMKEVVYTKRDILKDSSDMRKFNPYLEYSNGLTVNTGRSIIGYLPEQVENILKTLKEEYNFDFGVKLEKIVKKEENYNVHVEIFKEKIFKTMGIKPALIFKDIKKHLLGKEEYNSLQKKILGIIFKEKKNLQVIYQGKRGIKTLIETIRLWYETMEEKLEIVTSENNKGKLEKSDYYIFYNTQPRKEFNKVENKFLVIERTIETNNKERIVKIENTVLVEDFFKIPKNIEIKTELELIEGYREGELYYTKKLPIRLKVRIKEELERGRKVMATEDILRIL